MIIGSGNMVHNLRMVAWEKMNTDDFGEDRIGFPTLGLETLYLFIFVKKYSYDYCKRIPDLQWQLRRSLQFLRFSFATQQHK
jgi:hypothetical protein